ncbi:MAG: ISAs1 family transposase [Chloroflexota bacterium]|nr:MAG: ISAs1 family transposase [Chloroflexota bacterium]
MKQYIAPTFDVNLDPAGLVFDLTSLYATFARLTDGRDVRGIRYSLPTMLTFVTLAKLSGENSLAGIAEWVNYRIDALSAALGLKKKRAPVATTYSRVLADAVDVQELEGVIHDFFASQPHAGQSVHLIIDGKELRGTIAAGQRHGIRLLAAFLPAEGWVLLQVQVARGENEIGASLRLLQALDLRGKIVSGDALLAQHELSRGIVEGGGEYLWTVKTNQAELYADIQTLFAPERVTKGFSAPQKDLRQAASQEKRHGRLECRILTASRELKGYLGWPYAEQVFQVERHTLRLKDGKATHALAYGITSLTPHEASAQRLLDLVREHWQIETGLHCRRDQTLREDWCHVRRGSAPQALATLNNLIIGLVLRPGKRNLAHMRRRFNAFAHEALHLVLASPI